MQYSFRSTLVSLSVFTLFQFSIFAKEETLAKITSDMDNDYALLVYERGENGDVEHLYADQYSKGVRVERAELKDSELDRGIVLLRKDRYDIMKIQSSDFDRSRGGTLKLDTLYSALSGERRVYEFNMTIDLDRVFFDVKGQEFNHMHFIAKRSRILGPIGIEKIQYTKD